MTAWLALLAWAVTAGALRRQLALSARARHEVRGPLCIARLALGGLERSARVEAIELELRRAALALEELSGAARSGGRHEIVDVARLLSQSAPAWRALAASHGSTLRVEGGAARVAGDRLRLAQACANLVANALEHGGGEGGVTVRSWTAGGMVRIEVADTGPGLPAPLPALLTAARGRRSPRGHGLAIAAAIAERHGGRLTTSPARQGTRLVLELPEARMIPVRRRSPTGRRSRDVRPSPPAAVHSPPAGPAPSAVTVIADSLPAALPPAAVDSLRGAGASSARRDRS